MVGRLAWLLVVACHAQRAALPRLVLHVGSHKTGTTFAQRFLVNGVDDLGVACVACAHEKEAAVLPAVLLNATSGPSVRYDDRRAFDAVVAEIRRGAAERPATPMVLSAEGLGRLSPPQWHALREALGGGVKSVVLLHVHRGLASWARAMWPTVAADRSFGEFLADTGAWARVGARLTALLGSVVRNWPGASLESVSYDALAEKNSSVPEYLICRAARRLRGAPLRACRARVRAKAARVDRANVSPSAAAVDARRLARAIYLSRLAAAGCREERGAWRPSWAAAARVAADLPLACGADDSLLRSLARDGDAAWAAASGARPPRAEPPWRACLVDTARLELRHYALLGALVDRDAPPCGGA